MTEKIKMFLCDFSRQHTVKIFIWRSREFILSRHTNTHTCDGRRPVQVESTNERDVHIQSIVNGIYAQTKYICFDAHSQWPSDTHLAIYFLVNSWFGFSFSPFPFESYIFDVHVYVSLFLFLSRMHA